MSVQVQDRDDGPLTSEAVHQNAGIGTDNRLSPTMLKTCSRYLFGVLFIAAGINHFVNPAFYVAIMPPYLPWHSELVAVSGLAEVGLGVMLLFRRWAVWAGWGLIALLVAIFPANVHMALHPELYPSISPLLLWLRLPLQPILIAWAWLYTRR